MKKKTRFFVKLAEDFHSPARQLFENVNIFISIPTQTTNLTWLYLDWKGGMFDKGSCADKKTIRKQ